MMTSGCSASLLASGGAGLRRGGWSVLMLTSICSGPQCIADGRKQNLCVEGLAEEAFDAERALLVGNLVPPGDQEHRQTWTHLLHQVAKFKAVDTGQADIGDQHVEARQPAVEQRSCRGEAARHIAGGFQKVLQRLEEPRIVIDDGHDGSRLAHSLTPPARREWVIGISSLS